MQCFRRFWFAAAYDMNYTPFIKTVLNINGRAARKTELMPEKFNSVQIHTVDLYLSHNIPKSRHSMRQFLSVIVLSLGVAQVSHAEIAPFFALLSLDEATKIVRQQGGNKVLATKTENVGGKQLHIIKVLTPEGRIQHIKVDATSGKIIK